MKINDAIRKMMEKKSFNNAQLADELEVRPQQVSNYLNGQWVKGVKKPISVTVDTAVDIAYALGYRLVLVPKRTAKDLEEKLDNKDERYCFVVDERLTAKRPRRSGKNSEK